MQNSPRNASDKTPPIWLAGSPAFLRNRADELEAEWMDAPGANPEHLRKSLRYLRRINVLLGYTRATLRQLDRYRETWPAHKPIRILDVATGSGDVPRAILRWAKRRGVDVQVVGIDLHAQTAQSANEAGVGIVRGDARLLPFADDSFDYVISALFLHHLPAIDAQSVLREIARVAGRGIIVSDLLRHRRAYFWICLLSAWANPMVRHDARVSVMQAFTRPEVVAMRDAAGLTYVNYLPQPGHRFMLTGEKLGNAR
jgi:ubiquinone/menaquinone biosynthesis C-methylase UbiE